MVADNDTNHEPFDVDAYLAEVDARIAALGLTPEQVSEMHRQAAAGITQTELDEADEIARRFFERVKKNRGIPRPADARSRGSA